MTDRDCILLLQWALPRLRLRWPGFRKVRGQVCKRVAARMRERGLPDAAAYREQLEQDPGEWTALDGLCRITISRFSRDRGVFSSLQRAVLPALARNATGRGDGTLSCWSAGCASGEEPYTLAILWQLRLQKRFPGLRVTILATDADEKVIERALEGRYRPGSLKELPAAWRRAAFDLSSGGFRIKRPYQDLVRFLRHDVRDEPPGGSFDLVLCRNLAFTYFDEALQDDVLNTFRIRLVLGGALVIGSHESLPRTTAGFEPWGKSTCIYRRV